MNEFYEGSDRRWLFAFTHPDDEIAACALIKRLTSSGAGVWCGWSVAPSFREREARNSMIRLGVPQDNLFFLSFPDGDACEHLSELTQEWRSILEQISPTDLVVCAYECGHLDHDSTNFAVCTAAKGHKLRVYEYPLYHTYLTRSPILNRFANPAEEAVLQMSETEQKLKWEIARNYPSQNIASLLVWYTVAGWVGLRPAGLKLTERYRPMPAVDYLAPNLPYELHQRVSHCDKWQRWCECVRRALSLQQFEETN